MHTLDTTCIFSLSPHMYVYGVSPAPDPALSSETSCRGCPEFTDGSPFLHTPELHLVYWGLRYLPLVSCLVGSPDLAQGLQHWPT